MSPDDTTKRVAIYGCPSSECQFVSGGVAEMNDHVGDRHEGEFENYWPEPLSLEPPEGPEQEHPFSGLAFELWRRALLFLPPRVAVPLNEHLVAAADRA